MKRRITRVLLCLVAVALPGVLYAQDDDGPASDQPELKVLAHLPGAWTGTIEGDKSDNKLELSSRWILGGHVLETKIKLGNYESRMLRTWDKANQRYALTYMDGSGTVLLMTGQWDEEKKELSASGKQGARTVTLTTQFVDETTTKWTIRDGENVISGLNRRDSQ